MMKQTTYCPETEKLRDHLVGQLPAEDERSIVTHLDTCEDCQQTLVSMSVAESSLLELAAEASHEELHLTSSLT